VQGWRTQGIGPPYVKIGGRLVRYPVRGIITHLQENLVSPNVISGATAMQAPAG
jgi:hypothetical protein